MHLATATNRILILAAVCCFMAASAVGQFWEPAGSGITGTQALSARAIGASGGGVILYGGGGAGGEAPAADAGIYRSTDAGDSWTHVLNVNPRVVTFKGDYAFVATVNAGIYRSADGGEEWTQVNTGLTRNDFYALAASEGENALVAGSITGVFRSLNNGASWTMVGPGIDTNALAFGPGEDVWAGEYNFDFDLPGIYYSAELGDAGTWEPRGLQGERVNAIQVGPDGTVWVGVAPEAGLGGLFRSTDNGASWTRIDIDDTIWTIQVVDENTIWVGGSFGAYVSTNGGDSFTADNTGIPDDDGAIRSMTLDAASGRLFIAERFTDVAVYRSVAPLVSAADVSQVAALQLEPVFPNPATGSVTLSFTLAEAGPVTLRVFDMLGRQVAIAARGTHAAGQHNVMWSSLDLPSGVYVAHLESGTQVSVQRFSIVR